MAWSWGDVMWEELRVSFFENIVTIGNGHKKLFSREAGASSFLKLSLLLQLKLRSTERGSLQVLAVL